MNAPPDALRLAGALVDRATADLGALRTLVTHTTGIDEIAGFHAQQAVEKSLKAALLLAGCDVPRTHDLVFIVDLAIRNGVAVPLDPEAAEALYPYAVEFRYSAIPIGASLPVETMYQVAEAAVSWAVGLVEAAGLAAT